jgi:hypothetical protein
MNVYTAEDCGGDVFLIGAWDGLDRESFKEFVLENLSRNHIPEPDRNIQELDLCEWDEATFFAWHTPLTPVPAGAPKFVTQAAEFITRLPEPNKTWQEACYGHLYWTYPGVWSETNVTKMPPELAAEFWTGEGVDRTDPKHPGFHDLMAGHWDLREKG